MAAHWRTGIGLFLVLSGDVLSSGTTGGRAIAFGSGWAKSLVAVPIALGLGLLLLHTVEKPLLALRPRYVAP